MTALQQVLDQALALSDDDQDRLLAHLIGRAADAPEHARAWELELARRIDEPDDDLVDWDEAKAEIFRTT